MPSYPIPHFIDLLGMPFKPGARGPLEWDCYGYTRELFSRVGVKLPDFESPSTLEGMEQLFDYVPTGPRWRPVPIGTPGTLITFRVDGAGAHCGFMLNGGRFTHCIQGEGCTTERLAGNWRMRPLASYIYE